ncbi:MAG: lysophospholipid acyltransferase family protein [Terrimicrobiaceae bacterium]|nr:lysophospholipid acyltransferase family protein [Terrimicrobiaceae bacterium]
MTRERLLALVASFLARLLFATLRLRVSDRSGFLGHSPDFPVIFTFWHNRILAITTIHRVCYPHHQRKGVAVLTSPSRDGEILAQLMACFRMGAIRGSSSRRGSRALRECADWLKSGSDLAVTPDGPKGPRYSLGPGLILLAQTTGARILPLHAHFSRAIALKSWDGFRIPLPFSRVEVTLGAYETIPATATPEAFEAERLRIETLLRNEAD